MRAAPIVVALLTLTSAFLPASSAGAQPPSTRARCISRSGAPIEQALQPDDEIVVIQEWGHIDYVAVLTKTPRQELKRLKDMADAVAVIEVDRVEPSLGPERNWITTQVTGSLRDIFKNAGLPGIDPDGRVRVTIDGGRLRIGTVDVRTWQFLEISAGSRYLFFFQRPGENPDAAGMWPAAGWWPFAVHRVDEEGKLRETWTADPCRVTYPDESARIEGMTLEAARRELRKK
jgi:hypothetical protein